MNKKWIIGLVITIVLGLAVGIGLAIYSSNSSKNDETEGIDVKSQKELANASNNVNELITENGTNSIETSAQEDNISPNAVIIEKTYYDACDHLTRKIVDVPEELVNKNRDEVEEMYSEWEIEEYSPTQIILYRKSNENCGEHYFVQEHNGVIGIYTIDANGVKSLKEDTEISTQYLPEADLQNLKAGVEIIGNTKLVEFLEDYE